LYRTLYASLVLYITFGSNASQAGRTVSVHATAP